MCCHPCTFFVGCCLFLPALVSVAAASPPRWFKGQLHVHTINSDGDSPPYEVVAWYKRQGFRFLAITDHDTLTDPARFDTNPNDSFLLLGGEEITNANAIHVNGIGIHEAIAPQKEGSATEILQANIDAIREQGGIALINHPNFGWALNEHDILPVRHASLLEIYSPLPLVSHHGDGIVPSTEELWDRLLSAGMRLFAVAVDDAHFFRPEIEVGRVYPGRGWVVVRAPELTREAILRALSDGDFYASNGVQLEEIEITPESLTIKIKPEGVSHEQLAKAFAAQGETLAPHVNLLQRYRVVFIGKEGRVLASSNENPARYSFRGDEGYVRARVESSGGAFAWTQPVFLDGRREGPTRR